MERTTDVSVDDEVEGPSVTPNTRGKGWLFRSGQIALGVVVVLAGIVMSGPGVPGPGLVVILVGLNLIKPNNRLYRWLRRRTPGLPNEGPIPRRTIVLGVSFALALTAASILISIKYGESITTWLSAFTDRQF